MDVVKDHRAQLVRLKDMKTLFVSLVNYGANGREFLSVKSAEPTNKAAWTKAFINDLPDAAFALIAPGGGKDKSGRTFPRSLRYLPHHNETVRSPAENGSIDRTHLNAALSRVNQLKVSPALKAQAMAHLRAHMSGGSKTKRKEKVFMDPATGQVTVTPDEEQDVTKGAAPAATNAPVVDPEPAPEAPAPSDIEETISKSAHDEALLLAQGRIDAHETIWAVKAVEKIGLRAGETIADMQLSLRRAIEPIGKSLMGTAEQGHFFVRDVLDKSAVVGVLTDRPRFNEVSVSRDEKGAFTFGSPEEVVARTVYEPADMTKQAALVLKDLGGVQKSLATHIEQLKAKLVDDEATQEATDQKAAQAVAELRGDASLNGAGKDPVSASEDDPDSGWSNDMNDRSPATDA